MKRIAIIEDEKHWANQLSKILNEWMSKNESIDITAFLSGEDILRQFNTADMEYDIIFLDIKLPGMDGLETARILRDYGYENELVIISNHKDFEYAQRGFDVNAMQYYTKPVLYKDIEKIMDRTNRKNSFYYIYGGEQVSVPYKDILYFESLRNYIQIKNIHLNMKLPPFRSNIMNLASNLPRIFVQCHRSFIVNISHVIKLMDTKAFLRNGDGLQMGKQFIQDVVGTFRDYK